MQRITDSYGRTFDYLRLAVTDRCNMRCFYCMPADGIQYLPRKELLSYEEMLFILQSLSELGVTKVRITGGEPFLRKDLIHFLEEATKINGIQSFHITTNGFLIGDYIDELKRLGITSINLSLDSLDPDRFSKITRTNHFEKVRNNLDRLIQEGFKLKINMVAMQGLNDQDIPEMASLAKDLAGRGIAVAVFCPGWAKTEMGGPGASVPPDESIRGLKKLIADLSLDTSGTFHRYNGDALAW